MRLLLVGGAGRVGQLILPGLRARHDVRVFDLRPPAVTDGDGEHVVGDATDPTSLALALEGVDAVVHCAMPPAPARFDAVETARPFFDVNVTSVYVTLRLALQAGVPHAVLISSMSVYRDLLTRRSVNEDEPTDADDPYGLTKRLGEQVARTVADRGLSVTVLRLTWPTSDEAWPTWQGPDGRQVLHRADDGVPMPATAATDVTRAVLAALEYRNGFAVFGIAGDPAGHVVDVTRARTVLGWEPTAWLR